MFHVSGLLTNKIHCTLWYHVHVLLSLWRVLVRVYDISSLTVHCVL